MKDALLEAQAVNAALANDFDEALKIWRKTEDCIERCGQGLNTKTCGKVLQGRILFLSLVVREDKYHVAADKFGKWLEAQEE